MRAPLAPRCWHANFRRLHVPDLDTAIHLVPLSFVLNGRSIQRSVPAERLLCDLLRDDLGLQGTKLACARGACGACVTLIDGCPRASCSTFAFQVDGRELTSIEGLSRPGEAMHPIQQAFAQRSAFQCGYCTAGMVLLTKALLEAHPDPDRDTIVEWISSNICRCTGYALIIEAVQDAAQRLRAGGPR
jgi:aerobic carbon-monoxide dehydrogenase small subunit